MQPLDTVKDLAVQPAPAPNGHQWHARHVLVYQRAVGLQKANQVLARLQCAHKQQETRLEPVPRRDSRSFLSWQRSEGRVGGQVHDGDLVLRHIQQRGQVVLGSSRVGQDVIGAPHCPLDLTVVVAPALRGEELRIVEEVQVVDRDH